MGVGGQRHAPAALPPGKRPGTHCIGRWVGPRDGLDGCGKFRPTGIRSPECPACSEAPYRLHKPPSPTRSVGGWGRRVSGLDVSEERRMYWSVGNGAHYLSSGVSKSFAHWCNKLSVSCAAERSDHLGNFWADFDDTLFWGVNRESFRVNFVMFFADRRDTGESWLLWALWRPRGVFFLMVW